MSVAGPDLGLSGSEQGNPELGHRAIGAGRTVLTDADRVRAALSNGEFENNPTLSTAFARAAADRSSVHFVGLLSDGGVHSSPEVVFSLLRAAKTAGVRDAFVHCILDGRDVRPRTADIYVDALEIKMADIGLGKIASLCGRFYGMDAAGNWERTARAYTMIVHGEGERSFDAVTAIRASFLRGISDEFIAPVVIEQRMDVPVATVKDGDLVVFFNHNGEGMLQLARSLAVPDATSAKPKAHALCVTEYDGTLALPSILPNRDVAKGLASVFVEYEVASCRITESARSRHLSSFLDGGSRPSGEIEQYTFLDSPTRGQIETTPESKSFKIADAALSEIGSRPGGVFVINLPAAALSAESGDFERTVEAVQYVDTCLGGIVGKLREAGGTAVVTASHGGCESVGSAATGKVPFLVVGPDEAAAPLTANGKLSDVAPTILGLLGLPQPPEMTGRDLRMI